MAVAALFTLAVLFGTFLYGIYRLNIWLVRKFARAIKDELSK